MPALTQSDIVQFGDMPAPVLLRVPASMLSLLARLLRGWRVQPWCGPDCRPVLAMQMTPAGRFRITGGWVPEPVECGDDVDAACAFIAELVRAYVNEVPARLCLHAAGAVFAGRLVILLGTRRAGKSILCAAMAAAGLRLAGDDVIMIDAVDGDGLAGGFSPRLRLPLPPSLAPATRAFIDAHGGPRGRQYAYLTPAADLIAGKDERFAIGAFIVLDRRDSGPAVLRPIEKSTLLSAVIWQNFARRAPSTEILDRLHALVARSVTGILEYSTAEEAVSLLQQRFASWSPGVPAATPPAGEATASPRLGAAAGGAAANGLPPTGRLRHRAGITERRLDDRNFLADDKGGTITVLNPMATAIWHALREPATAGELVDLAALAFPATDRAVIAADVASILGDFLLQRLIEPA